MYMQHYDTTYVDSVGWVESDASGEGVMDGQLLGNASVDLASAVEMNGVSSENLLSHIVQFNSVEVNPFDAYEHLRMAAESVVAEELAHVVTIATRFHLAVDLDAARQKADFWPDIHLFGAHLTQVSILNGTCR